MDFRPQTSPSQPHHPHQATTPAAAGAGPKTTKGDKMIKRQKQMILWLIIAILFIAAVGTAAYYVKRYHDSQNQVKKLQSNPTVTQQQQTQALINKVGKLTNLPTGETPTVATVTDITKLSGQAFFDNAKNGDKVLIYTGAKEAFLYRPSTNKIINIAPVNLGSSSSTTGSTSNSTSKTSTTTNKTP